MAELLQGARHILEVGPGTGVLARLLVSNGVRVTGIEKDASSIEPARHLFERLLIADVERMDASLLSGDPFDAIVFGDVLEHLRDPASVLRSLLPVLKPDGAIVASIPNIAHGAVRLSLVQGRFDYAERGLLNGNHLRFFTRVGIIRLLSDVDLHVHRWRYVTRDPLHTEVPLDPESLPEGLLEYVRLNPESFVYQYVVDARRTPPERVEEQLVEATEALSPPPPERPTANNVERLRSDLAQAYGRLAEMTRELEQLHEWQRGIRSLPGARLAGFLLRLTRRRR